MIYYIRLLVLCDKNLLLHILMDRLNTKVYTTNKQTEINKTKLYFDTTKTKTNPVGKD